MPAQLIRMSGQPRSSKILAMASVTALASRTSRLQSWIGMPVVEWSSAAALSPSSCLWSRRAMAEAPASARAWDMFHPRPRAPL